MSISRGDRVVTTENLGLFGFVRRGAEGAVVSEPNWLTGEFEVVFDNGDRERVRESEVVREGAGFRWW